MAPRAVSLFDDASTRLLRTRAGTVFSHWPGALVGEEEAVHELRVAGRRLRVALPLCARKPEGRRVRRLRRLLQGVIRAAGSCRDLDVAVTLFDAVASETPQPAATRRLRRRLRAARSRTRRRMTVRLLDQDIARLRTDLKVTLARGGAARPVVVARLREARERRAGAAVESMRSLGAIFDPEALHDQRRAIRSLRYTAEVGVELGHARAGVPKLLKELQEQLGEIHDRHVLAGWLGARALRAEQRGEPDLADEARRIQGLARGQGEERHRAYLASGPAAAVLRAAAEIAPAGPGALRRSVPGPAATPAKRSRRADAGLPHAGAGAQPTSRPPTDVGLGR